MSEAGSTVYQNRQHAEDMATGHMRPVRQSLDVPGAVPEKRG